MRLVDKLGNAPKEFSSTDGRDYLLKFMHDVDENMVLFDILRNAKDPHVSGACQREIEGIIIYLAKVVNQIGPQIARRQLYALGLKSRYDSFVREYDSITRQTGLDHTLKSL